jgi:hypothetical protein
MNSFSELKKFAAGFLFFGVIFVAGNTVAQTTSATVPAKAANQTPKTAFPAGEPGSSENYYGDKKKWGSVRSTTKTIQISTYPDECVSPEICD